MIICNHLLIQLVISDDKRRNSAKIFFFKHIYWMIVIRFASLCFEASSQIDSVSHSNKQEKYRSILIYKQYFKTQQFIITFDYYKIIHNFCCDETNERQKSNSFHALEMCVYVKYEISVCLRQTERLYKHKWWKQRNYYEIWIWLCSLVSVEANHFIFRIETKKIPRYKTIFHSSTSKCNIWMNFIDCIQRDSVLIIFCFPFLFWYFTSKRFATMVFVCF